METGLKQIFMDDAQALPESVTRVLSSLDDDTLVLCKDFFQEIKNHRSLRNTPASRVVTSTEVTKAIFDPDKHRRAIENVMLCSSYNFPPYSMPLQVFIGKYSVQQIEQVIEISQRVRQMLAGRYSELFKQRNVVEYIYPRIEDGALFGVQTLPLELLITFLNDYLSKCTKVQIAKNGAVVVDGVTLGGCLSKTLVVTLRAVPDHSVMTADEIGKRRGRKLSKKTIHQHIAEIRSFFEKHTTRHGVTGLVIKTVGREGYMVDDSVRLVFE